MVQALIALVAVLMGVGIYTAVRLIHSRDVRRRNVTGIKAQASWQEATKVQELITLYLDVALVHGPDSQEAKAFKFGVENSELWHGNDAMEIYGKMIKICDSAFRRHKTWKRK